MITLYDMAMRYVGLHEVEGVLDNPKILEMLRLDQSWPEHDEVPWCSAAVNWWAWQLRLPRSKSLLARSWLNVGKPIQTSELKVGWDVVVLWGKSREGTDGHVGLFAGFNGPEHVLVLGGNQSDAVSISPFPTTKVLGCRRLLEHS